ncbi:MAG: hypothetical protein MJE68_22690 [Proteobacteria bacterium]|nr:hypothetical protein [Pseudomonadota bacterium]
MATGRRVPEDDTDVEIKVCKAMVTPHPSLAIIRFWQGAVEILLRVTSMVRSEIKIILLSSKTKLEKLMIVYLAGAVYNYLITISERYIYFKSYGSDLREA